MADRIPYSSLPESVRSQWTQTSWEKIEAGLQQKIFKSVTGALKSSISRSSKFKDPDQIDFAKDELGTLSDLASARERDADVVMGAYKQLIQEGQFFALDGPFLKGLGEAVKKQNVMFAQPKLGAEAYMTMSKNVQQFNKLTDDAFNKTGNFTARLADQAAILSKLGLRQATFSDNLQTAIYDLGMNQKGVEDFNMSIKKLADGLDMLPEQVSRNFRQVAANLMYDAGTIKEEYAKLEALAQKTGLSSTQLAQQFGSGMDTISGASSAASSLNAMLGRNAFSATELLGMSESERAEAIREAVQSDSNLMSDINAGGAQGKFAMISVAEALGMDRQSARRFIQTGEADSVKSKIEAGVTADTGAGLSPSVLVENFKTPAKSLKTALDELRKQVEVTMNPMRLGMIQNRRAQLAQAEAGQMPFLEQVGRLTNLGLLPDGVTQEQFAEIAKDPGALGTFKELVRREQMGLVERGTTRDLAKSMTGTASDRRRGLQAATSLVARPEDLTGRLTDAGKAIDPAVMSILVQMMKANQYGGRVMFREAIDYLVNTPGATLTKEQAQAYVTRAEAIQGELKRGKDLLTDGAGATQEELRTYTGGLFNEGGVMATNLDPRTLAARRSATAPTAEQQQTEDERLKQEVEGISANNPRFKNSSVQKSGNNWTIIFNVEGDEAMKLQLNKVMGEAKLNSNHRKGVEKAVK